MDLKIAQFSRKVIVSDLIGCFSCQERQTARLGGDSPLSSTLKGQLISVHLNASKVLSNSHWEISNL